MRKRRGERFASRRTQRFNIPIWMSAAPQSVSGRDFSRTQFGDSGFMIQKPVVFVNRVSRYAKVFIRIGVFLVLVNAGFLSFQP